MAQLPVVSGTQIQTPVGGVKLNPDSFRQAALAPGRIANELGENVGGVMGDISQKLQANFNAQQVFKADLAMRKTKDDFTASLVKMPDPGTWLPAWKDQVTGQRDAIINNPKNGPEVKRQLGMMFDRWEQSTTSEIKIQALRKQVSDSREDAIADSTYAAHQGDIEGAQNTLKAAVENHAMSPADANRIGKRFPTIAAQAKADTIIAGDPIGALDQLPKLQKDLEPRMYVSLQAKAREARSAAQTSNLNDFAQQLDLSPDGTIESSALKQAVKDKRITQRGADMLDLRMKKTALYKSKEDFNYGMSNATDYDWTEDKNPAATVQAMKEDGAQLPAPLRIRLYNHIDKLANDAKKSGEKLERPVEKQIFDQMREDRNENGYTVPLTNERVTAGWWWDRKTTDVHNQIPGGLNAIQNSGKITDEQIEQLYGKGVKREDVIRAEQSHYASIQNKMRQWFTDPANKGATYEQANAYRIELEKPFVMGQVSAALNAPTPARRLVKQNGKTYDFNTGEEVK